MYGDLIEAMLEGFVHCVIIAIVATAIIASCLTFAATRYFAPTPDSIAKDKRRQEVVNQLTPEQREVLGVK